MITTLTTTTTKYIMLTDTRSGIHDDTGNDKDYEKDDDDNTKTMTTTTTIVAT